MLLGNPDTRLKFIHVAGTNGKGSICSYLSSVLKQAGYRVGTYNSPSVFRYNERWSIDGEALSDGLVAKYLSEVSAVIEKENLRRRFCPTAFEIETAVAMLAFLEQRCDIVVLETGLGGRWDATNVVYEKELAVIAPIGLDHCVLLGNTLSEIASEKAAIIDRAKDRDAVTCRQSEEIMNEIYHPYRIVDDGNEYFNSNVRVCGEARLIESSLEGQTFEYDGKEYAISMLGEHQLQNASIAICAVEALREKGWKISEEALYTGLKNTVWHARFEIVKNAKTAFNIDIPTDKTLVFDGAHNPHGAKALAKALKEYFKNKSLHLVLGMLADKDTDGVIGILTPLVKRVTAVTPSSPRALDKRELKAKVEKYIECDVSDSVREAVELALSGDCDVTVLCGSLTLFGDLTK